MHATQIVLWGNAKGSIHIHCIHCLKTLLVAGDVSRVTGETLVKNVAKFTATHARCPKDYVYKKFNGGILTNAQAQRENKMQIKEVQTRTHMPNFRRSAI